MQQAKDECAEIGCDFDLVNIETPPPNIYDNFMYDGALSCALLCKQTVIVSGSAQMLRKWMSGRATFVATLSR